MRTSTTSAAAVPVTNSLTTILSESPNGLIDSKGYELNNATGGAALSDFQIQIQLRAGGTWFTAVAAADWAQFVAGSKQLPAFLLGVWTNPATLAANANSGFIIQPAGIYAYRFQAQTAASTATITLTGTGRTLR